MNQQANVAVQNLLQVIADQGQWLNLRPAYQRIEAAAAAVYEAMEPEDLEPPVADAAEDLDDFDGYW